MQLNRTALFSFLLLSVLGVSSVSAQSALHSLIDGGWVPVAEMKGKIPYCFTGDGLVKGDEDRVTMLPVSDFGEGFVKVDLVSNQRSGVDRSDEVLRFTSREGWYQMTALVTSDVDLSDCYYVMRFEMYGEIKFYCRPIGTLSAGKTQRVELFKKLGFEMPQQLHIYSGMEEVRSSLVPGEYRYEFGEFLLADSR